MWQKVTWLTFWVSMVLWFGNIWGCAAPGMEQNYKVSEPDRHPPSRELYGRSVLVMDDSAESEPVAFYAQASEEAPKPAAPGSHHHDHHHHDDATFIKKTFCRFPDGVAAGDRPPRTEPLTAN